MTLLECRPLLDPQCREPRIPWGFGLRKVATLHSHSSASTSRISDRLFSTSFLCNMYGDLTRARSPIRLRAFTTCARGAKIETFFGPAGMQWLIKQHQRCSRTNLIYCYKNVPSPSVLYPILSPGFPLTFKSPYFLFFFYLPRLIFAQQWYLQPPPLLQSPSSSPTLYLIAISNYESAVTGSKLQRRQKSGSSKETTSLERSAMHSMALTRAYSRL